MTALVTVPHLLYDSLYVESGARLPKRTYFFAKHVGAPLWPLWHTSAGRPGEPGETPQVQFFETNMLIANALPMPETFTIERVFLCEDTREELPSILDHCEYEIHIAGRIVGGGHADRLEAFSHHPQEFFKAPRAKLGSFQPPPLAEQFYGFEVPSGCYFSVEFAGGPMKLSSPLMLWFCLMGTWKGPVPQTTPGKAVEPR
jgi:hypothetical protein